MVTPIDAVHSGMGFDTTGHWHEARIAWLNTRPRESDDERSAPVRGIFYGLVLSGVLWVGIIAGVRAIIHHF